MPSRSSCKCLRVTISEVLADYVLRRPKLFDFSEFQVLTKYIKKMGPAWFRSKLVDILPIQEFRDMKRIVTKMHTESVNILDRKRAALNSGDDALTKAVGEGKDIMSILCKFFCTSQPLWQLISFHSACQYDCVGRR